jgi:adenylate cyclase class IV
MIEVEQKFKLSEEKEARLIEGAEFLNERTFTDVYYDTGEYTLTKNDIWLRKRGDKWEVKIPMSGRNNWMSQQYQEVEGEEKIRQVFDIPPKHDFETDIAEFGYVSFCACKTTRKKYSKDKFIIDLDLVDYGDFTYKIAEIEIMVPSSEHAQGATDEILKFAKSLGLEIAPVRGKVIEYLKNKKPDHYQALNEAGVVEG